MAVYDKKDGVNTGKIKKRRFLHLNYGNLCVLFSVEQWLDWESRTKCYITKPHHLKLIRYTNLIYSKLTLDKETKEYLSILYIYKWHTDICLFVCLFVCWCVEGSWKYKPLHQSWWNFHAHPHLSKEGFGAGFTPYPSPVGLGGLKP